MLGALRSMNVIGGKCRFSFQGLCGGGCGDCLMFT
jgi:hypothetical protein